MSAERTRTELLEAALVCVERNGIARTTVEDVARQAGRSRATVYRYFPEGRTQVISETVTWEVGRFIERLGEAIAEETDLAGRLRVGLMWGHRAIEQHDLLQQVLRTEPEALLAELVEVGPQVFAVLRAELRNWVDDDATADYLTRLFMSYVGSQGQWDLSDPAEVDRLVRTQFLPWQ